MIVKKIGANLVRILVISVLTAAVSAFHYTANAAHGQLPILPRLQPGPFGGKIHEVVNCNCPLSYAKKIDVGPPVGGKSFMVIEGLGAGILGALGIDVESDVYDYKQIDEGEWVLGTSSIPPVPCFRWVITVFGPSCEEEGVGWYVKKVGTSNIGGGLGGF